MESHLLYVASAYFFVALILFLFSANSYFSNIYEHCRCFGVLKILRWGSQSKVSPIKLSAVSV